MSKRNSDLGNAGPSFKKQQLEPSFDDISSHLEGKECPSANAPDLKSVVHDLTSEEPSASTSRLELDDDDLTSHLEMSQQLSSNECSSEHTDNDNFSDISEAMPNKNTLANLRREIYDLERRQLLNFSPMNSINFINRYWKRFDEDWCLLLQKLDDSKEPYNCLDASTSSSTSSNSSSYQLISQLDPENFDIQLASRVEKTKQLIMNVKNAFNKHKKRREILEQALNRLEETGDLDDDNTAKDIWQNLLCENTNLENFTATLKKSYHDLTPKVQKCTNDCRYQDHELKRLQCKYEKLLELNKKLQGKNYQLELDLETLRSDFNNCLLEDSGSAQAKQTLDEDIAFIDEDASQIRDKTDGDGSQNHENVGKIFTPQEQDRVETIEFDNCERLESISLPLNEPEYSTDAADELDKLAISTLSDITCSIDDKIQDKDFLEPSTSNF